MYPILVRIGPVTVHSYSALLGVGLLLSLVILYRRSKVRIARPDLWLDGALLALIVGTLGARLGYVAANWVYFQDRTAQILKFWLGGLEWRGALVGASFGMLVYASCQKIRFWRLADELALVAPVVAAAGWMGCLLSGCSYGEEVSAPHWLAADLPDLFGVWAVRYNVQLFAAAWSLLVAAILFWVARRTLPSGSVAGLFMALLGPGVAIADSLRGDVAPVLWGWRMDVVVDWLMTAAGLAILLGVSWRRRMMR